MRCELKGSDIAIMFLLQFLNEKVNNVTKFRSFIFLLTKIGEKNNVHFNAYILQLRNWKSFEVRCRFFRRQFNINKKLLGSHRNCFLFAVEIIFVLGGGGGVQNIV